jgi:hypothetical protein
MALLALRPIRGSGTITPSLCVISTLSPASTPTRAVCDWQRGTG